MMFSMKALVWARLQIESNEALCWFIIFVAVAAAAFCPEKCFKLATIKVPFELFVAETLDTLFGAGDCHNLVLRRIYTPLIMAQ